MTDVIVLISRSYPTRFLDEAKSCVNLPIEVFKGSMFVENVSSFVLFYPK